MNLTSGEIYNKNKLHYDNLAIKYIQENLKNINDICYVPFTMQTYFTRTMAKKISDTTFIVFDGYISDIKIIDDVFSYFGKENNNCKEYNINEMIEYFGFEYSLNTYHRIGD